MFCNNCNISLPLCQARYVPYVGFKSKKLRRKRWLPYAIMAANDQAEAVGMQTGQILNLPPAALVVLAGPAGCGKSTFAARHFGPTQVVSSDRLRGWIADDEGDQSVSGLAFHLLYSLVSKRL